MLLLCSIRRWSEFQEPPRLLDHNLAGFSGSLQASERSGRYRVGSIWCRCNGSVSSLDGRGAPSKWGRAGSEGKGKGAHSLGLVLLQYESNVAHPRRALAESAISSTTGLRLSLYVEMAEPWTSYQFSTRAGLNNIPSIPSHQSSGDERSRSTYKTVREVSTKIRSWSVSSSLPVVVSSMQSVNLKAALTCLRPIKCARKDGGVSEFKIRAHKKRLQLDASWTLDKKRRAAAQPLGNKLQERRSVFRKACAARCTQTALATSTFRPCCEFSSPPTTIDLIIVSCC